MVLQVQDILGGSGARGPAGGGPRQVDVFLDDNAIVTHREFGGFFLRAVVVEAGGAELDVVRLPTLGRKACVHKRRGNVVQATAIAGGLGQDAERIQQLDFVAVLDVNAAVAASLAKRTGHEGHVEFEVEFAVANFRLGGIGAGVRLDPHAAVIVRFPLGVVPCTHIRRFTGFVREEDNGTFRWRLAFGWRMPFDLLEFEPCIVRAGHLERVIRGLGIPCA